MEKNYWEGKEYSYFSHKNCEFFACSAIVPSMH